MVASSLISIANIAYGSLNRMPTVLKRIRFSYVEKQLIINAVEASSFDDA